MCQASLVLVVASCLQNPFLSPKLNSCCHKRLPLQCENTRDFFPFFSFSCHAQGHEKSPVCSLPGCAVRSRSTVRGQARSVGGSSVPAALQAHARLCQGLCSSAALFSQQLCSLSSSAALEVQFGALCVLRAPCGASRGGERSAAAARAAPPGPRDGFGDPRVSRL